MKPVGVRMAYYASSPDGETVEIPAEVFVALAKMKEEKYNGEITLQVRSGGIAGVIMACKLK